MGKLKQMNFQNLQKEQEYQFQINKNQQIYIIIMIKMVTVYQIIKNLLTYYLTQTLYNHKSIIQKNKLNINLQKQKSIALTFKVIKQQSIIYRCRQSISFFFEILIKVTFEGRDRNTRIRQIVQSIISIQKKIVKKKIKIFDDDNSKDLNINEFRKAVKDIQVDITDQQIQEVFEYFDKDGSGSINYDEFLLTVRGPMNLKRRRLVQQAFQILDKDGSGVVDLYDIKQAYNAKMHPEVRSGKRTEDSVLLEFINTFESYTGFRGIKDGQITLPEFEDYYTFISASIDRDDYFDLMMNNAWKMNEFANKNLNTKGWTGDNQQKNTVQDYYNQNLQNRQQQQAQNKKKDNNFNEHPDVNNYYVKNPRLSQQAQEYFNQFKTKIITRGTRGIYSLRRLFRIIDDDNSKNLSLEEFAKCCKDLRMGLNEQQSQHLFDYFDRDGSGEISYDEFLISIVGEMNRNRKNLIQQVFNKLDRNKNGFIELDDIIGVYNTKQHPDVINGKKHEEEILGEFLDTFEQHHAMLNGDQSLRNRSVTQEEFYEYYNNVSASIDDDRYFELMIKNAWKI
ncbi:hypothetical protein IMG5_167000 [Ichthyophthirius multifiliis]|uniref:EF-hand domain-containing protein n=1 Tax=Ichthyophthirius multifiliis TaxID=5932 RepID=G0R0U6_ICHMU|nr:hypothetical protein IMG5_167000 [Ichthyophthirius multifiliis]EGR28906.1 hypothetical protein IMG5_167000 [Ichthyophthirius multifiliis]|eukprot:XP_004030142.1 hypothetical protein IMG5_167000 [Ichthyophthirius multifiliis]